MKDNDGQQLAYVHFDDPRSAAKPLTRDEARGEYCQAAGAGAMSELLQFIIVVGFGALCFGCGCLTAFIVTRNQWRGDMIKRGFANYNERTGKWEWGEQASRRH